MAMADEPPTDIIQRLTDIFEERGDIQDTWVVEDAKDLNSPLHDEFEWNDTQAASLYRLHQARLLITRWRVVIRTSTNVQNGPQVFQSVLVKTASGDDDEEHEERKRLMINTILGDPLLAIQKIKLHLNKFNIARYEFNECKHLFPLLPAIVEHLDRVICEAQTLIENAEE